MNKYSSLLFFVLIIFSCTHRQSDKLELALKKAGKNKTELENVLSHYKKDLNDSLKFKAAKFLIENMPGHYTLYGKEVDIFRKNYKRHNNNIDGYSKKRLEEVDSVDYFTARILDVLKSVALCEHRLLNKEEDIKNITSEFLIRHIDAAFELKEQSVWLHNMPFEDFLEYILPYRFGCESLDLWLDSFKISNECIKFINEHENINRSVLKLGRFFEKQNNWGINYNYINKFLNIDFNKNCFGANVINLLKLRAMGIPVALDFIPAHPNRNGKHYWCEIISPETNANSMNVFQYYTTAKIYRYTYSHNQLYDSENNEFIPKLFKNPFIKDVTSKYLKTADIAISTKRKNIKPPKYAYLSVFNNQKWEPIAISQYDNKTVFKDVGRNILYLPIFYKGNLKYGFNYPFILYSDSRMEFLIPNEKEKVRIKLVRKYPYSDILHKYASSFENSVIEGSNDCRWNTFDTVCQFTDIGNRYIAENISSEKKYRFYRFKCSIDTSAYLSELYLMDLKGNKILCKYDDKDRNVFDNNPLTYIEVKSGETVCFNFTEPVYISRIICSPRSDGNGIYPGNKYELFYYELDGWRTLGKKIATDCYLEYDSLPSGALYWLHNMTEGVEERPFIIKNNNVQFW